jgi:SAM-dependent methyltransferase
LEGAVRLAVMARAHSGCEVWQQDFLKLDLPDNHFDGVFANAALFHVPSHELPRVLLELKASLKPGGFSSARIRVGITRKAGAKGATACIMILMLGAVICQSPGSSS